MAKLDIIVGPMFAGKSCELIKRIRSLKVLQKKFIVIKPKIDNRYEENMIVSHSFEKENCLILNKLSDIYSEEIFLDTIYTIFIDEGQFFDDLKEVVLNLVDNLNINVVITGLDGDFNRNKFGQILDLGSYADSIIKLNALCMKCMDGTPAPFTKKINSPKGTGYKDQIIEIGAGDIYESVCRKHYL